MNLSGGLRKAVTEWILKRGNSSTTMTINKIKNHGDDEKLPDSMVFLEC